MSTESKVKFLNQFVHRTFEDRCIIFPDAAEEITKGGIIIPDTVKEKPKSGTIVLVGPRCQEDVSIGDHVKYGRYAGQVVTIEGVEYDSVRVSEFIVGTNKPVSEVEPMIDRSNAIMHT